MDMNITMGMKIGGKSDNKDQPPQMKKEWLLHGNSLETLNLKYSEEWSLIAIERE